MAVNTLLLQQQQDWRRHTHTHTLKHTNTTLCWSSCSPPSPPIASAQLVLSSFFVRLVGLCLFVAATTAQAAATLHQHHHSISFPSSPQPQQFNRANIGEKKCRADSTCVCVFCVCTVCIIIAEYILCVFSRSSHKWKYTWKNQTRLGQLLCIITTTKRITVQLLKGYLFDEKKNAAATIQMKQIHWKFTKLVCRGNTRWKESSPSC